MNSVARRLSDLKLSLQELESAVQQPRDEKDSVDLVLERFPVVFLRFYEVVRIVLSSQGISVTDPAQAFTEAFDRGWVKGDLSLWMRLIADFQQLQSEEKHKVHSPAVAQDVRACSYMLWETYEVLTARFRWQTQVQPVAKPAAPISAQRYLLQSA